MARKKTIPFKFSEKHKEYIRACRDSAYNVAEGAVRAGKTVDNVFAFANEIKTSRDRIHLASGATVANARLNIGDADGFGLEFIFRGQCRRGKHQGNEALIIKGPDTGGRERVVIFAGAAKANSFEKIRGNSYGMWIATEINLHHDTFIKEAFNRQVAAHKLKVFWDLNPDHPKAPIYTKYIDRYQEMHDEKDFPGGYNYEHFTIDDNINIPDERKDAIKKRYDPGSVWYQRDILGRRMSAEGLIYKLFAQHYTKDYRDSPFFIDKEKLPGRYELIVVGVDFGHTGSKHAFVATGITHGYGDVISLMSERVEPGTPTELDQDFLDFMDRLIELYGMPDEIRADSAEQVLIRGLRVALTEKGLYIPIKNAIKGPIKDRIKLTERLMSQGRYFFTEDALSLAESHSEALWNEKIQGDERLDDGTTDIDSQDAHEYTLERSTRLLISD